MVRRHAILWFLALFGFVVPMIGTVSAGPAHAVAEPVASSGCPDHAPPPDPCPARDTAKHAAGVCCSPMSPSLALLSTGDDVAVAGPFEAPAPASTRTLAGLIFTKDPPPPRV